MAQVVQIQRGESWTLAVVVQGVPNADILDVAVQFGEKYGASLIKGDVTQDANGNFIAKLSSEMTAYLLGKNDITIGVKTAVIGVQKTAPVLVLEVLKNFNELRDNSKTDVVSATITATISMDEITTNVVLAEIYRGYGVAPGGTTGQYLRKKTNSDFDTEWVNSSGGGASSFEDLSGSPYDNTALNTALSEKANTADVASALDNKVDVEFGKGLSANDYTTDDRNKVANVPLDTNAELLNKANASHTHDMDDITGLNTALAGKVDAEAGKGLSQENFTTAEKNKLAGLSQNYKGTFSSLAALEAAYPTGEAGWEAIVDAGIGTDAVKYLWDASDNAWIEGGGSGASSFAELSGSPNDNAALASALAAKQNAEAGKGLSANDYTNADKGKVDNLPADTTTALAGKAASVHSHAISDVSGLQTALDGKASSTHSHAISDVTNLQTELDARENKLVSIDSLDADFTPAATDLRRWKRFTGTVARTITLPSDAAVALPIGFTFPFSQAGTGIVQWAAGSGATVNATDSATKLRGLHSAAQAVKVAANTWLIIGDITI